MTTCFMFSDEAGGYKEARDSLTNWSQAGSNPTLGTKINPGREKTNGRAHTLPCCYRVRGAAPVSIKLSEVVLVTRPSYGMCTTMMFCRHHFIQVRRSTSKSIQKTLNPGGCLSQPA